MQPSIPEFDCEQPKEVYMEALRLACKDLQATKKFCPRYHKLYQCSQRDCPSLGYEWTCWFQAYVERAREGEPAIADALEQQAATRRE